MHKYLCIKIALTCIKCNIFGSYIYEQIWRLGIVMMYSISCHVTCIINIVFWGSHILLNEISSGKEKNNTLEDCREMAYTRTISCSTSGIFATTRTRSEFPGMHNTHHLTTMKSSSHTFSYFNFYYLRIYKSRASHRSIS